MKTLSKFTLGRSNLDAVLGSQRSVLNKEGIGYSGNSNRLSCRNFLNISKPSSIICTYCSEPGHFSNSCYFKNCGVPKGEYKWVPKGTPQTTNMKGPKFNWYLHLLFNLCFRCVLMQGKQCSFYIMDAQDTWKEMWRTSAGYLTKPIIGHVTRGKNNKGQFFIHHIGLGFYLLYTSINVCTLMLTCAIDFTCCVVSIVKLCMPTVFKLCSCLPNLGLNPLSCSVWRLVCVKFCFT